MTSGLRKIHKFAWILISIAGIIFLSFTIKDLNFNSETSKVFNENEQVKVIKDGNEIKLEVKTSLKSSSSLVYAINSNGEKGQLLGQIQSEGIYTFNIIEPAKGIIIFDNIKNNELLKLNF